MHYKNFIDLNLIIQIKFFEGRKLRLYVVTIFKNGYDIIYIF